MVELEVQHRQLGPPLVHAPDSLKTYLPVPFAPSPTFCVRLFISFLNRGACRANRGLQIHGLRAICTNRVKSLESTRRSVIFRRT